jgi:TatD DNase family protein
MWIDSHCHLDASELAGSSVQLANAAVASGVQSIVIPAVHANLFAQVEQLALAHPACVFSLGIHPMYVPTSDESDLQKLRVRVAQLMTQEGESDLAKKLVAIGEIGLDYFVPELNQAPLKEKQEFFYQEQLKIAKEFELPVLLHVRRSQDQILKQLRRFKVQGGIAHAFNGSEQQAMHFVNLNFCLGFGGAMTYMRALQIRRLAQQLPLSALVLETDAPDISPSWLHPEKNRPDQVPAIGNVLAQLRTMSITEIASATSCNVRRVLPRLDAYLTSSLSK